MAVVCDTGAVYALYDADDLHHAACKAVVETERGPLFLATIADTRLDDIATQVFRGAPADIARLGFAHPFDRNELEFTSPLPADLAKALERARL